MVSQYSFIWLCNLRLEVFLQGGQWMVGLWTVLKVVNLVWRILFSIDDDAYRHRTIQNAATPGETLVALPGRRHEPQLFRQQGIEAANMTNIAPEYSYLFTNKLESQRAYLRNWWSEAQTRRRRLARAQSV
jgi:hypothetical protein